MEIGSFLELAFDSGKEYYKGDGIARLNSGRGAIYHAARCLTCDTIYLPYYQCDTVRDFLLKKNINVEYYSIDENFNPLISKISDNSAIVLVNYYGIMSKERLLSLSKKFDKVIIDNSQGFFCEPLGGCMNVYSARKFVGVPDGAYVIGENADRFLDEYKQDYSSDTSLFLLQRIEYGCEGKTYQSRMINEHRIDDADVMRMSRLTRTILDSANYDFIKNKRRENFKYAHSLFKDINKINPLMYYDESCVPMVYPLVVEDDSLLKRLLENKHFQGHWWSYLLDEIENDKFEYWLSRYVIPITIDQRYGKGELNFIYDIVTKGGQKA